MQRLIIDNFKVPSLNKSYAGRHWSKRHKEAMEIQELVWGLCQEQDIIAIKKYPIDIDIVAYYKSKAKRDSGNISNKEMIDYVISAAAPFPPG